jgi:hypothetical protein
VSQHGCDYDSLPQFSIGNKSLRTNLSVTERDYLAAERTAQHQEAPKFRRTDLNNTHNGSSRLQKRKSSSAFDILSSNSPHVSTTHMHVCVCVSNIAVGFICFKPLMLG